MHPGFANQRLMVEALIDDITAQGMIPFKKSTKRTSDLQLFQVAIFDLKGCHHISAPDDKIDLGLVLGAPIVDRRIG